MSDRIAAAPDPSGEHAPMLPRSWQHRRHPRRGGAPVPAVTVDSAAPGEVAERLRNEALRKVIETALVSPGSEPDAVEAVRRSLAGDADPAGAALLAALLVRYDLQEVETALERFVDAWITEHGLTFAARAVAELGRVRVFHFSVDHRHSRDADSIGFLGTDGHAFQLWRARKALRKVRALLAVAGDDGYEDAVKHLADHRGHPLQQAVTSYLVPTRHDWVEQACAARPAAGAYDAGWMLWCSVGTARHAEQVAVQAPLGRLDAQIDILATLLEGGGAAVAPYLAASLDSEYLNSDARKLLFQTLALLPTEEAFQHLVVRLGDPHARAALNEAAGRFPVRALRLLAPASQGTSKGARIALELLHSHIPAHPELVAGVLPALPADARSTVESIAASTVRLPDVPVDALPPVLAAPPWTVRRKAAEPVTITGLMVPDVIPLSWAPGEREEWITRPYGGHPSEEEGWDDLIRDFPTLGPFRQAEVILRGPLERVRPLLAGWEPESLWRASHWFRMIVGRFGTDALPVSLRVAKADPARAGGVLLPFRDRRVAALQAGWLMRLKKAREHAVAWFERHGLEAAVLLVPDAVGESGAARPDAEGALRHIASREGGEAVVEAARRYGDEVAEAIAAMFAEDPLEILPARIPKVPGWADPRALPQVLVRDRERALPPDATRHLLTMLAMSTPGETYPGVGIAREACDPASLAEFSWAVFRRWQAHDSPPKDGWALTQLGLLGDDDTVRRLAPMIRSWPGEGGYARAVQGLDVLAAIGTDMALLHLNGIAQKVKFKALRTRAQEKIDQIAADLELTPEELADRLVPDLGLDADGSLTLDYGPRRFTVGFDEALKPYVLDEDGKRRKALPKPGANDDPESAPAAYKRFSQLKKDVRTVAADQILRLQQAMVGERRWPLGRFHDLFVSHPLVWHLVRRLVLSAEHDGTTTLFRVAEDRTYADAQDEAIALPPTATIGIPHPLDLAEQQIAGWSQVFADYEILQPFAQLGRPVHALTDNERATGRPARFEGVTVPTGKILGLRRRGWELGDPQDAGIVFWISNEIAPGLRLTIGFEPGLAIGHVSAFPELTLTGIGLDTASGAGPSTFGDLPPKDVSEILTVLADLTGIPAS